MGYERLTKTYEDGSCGVADNLPCGENSHAFKDMLINRLGSYENSGLSPKQANSAEEKLVKLFKLLEIAYLALKRCNRGDIPAVREAIDLLEKALLGSDAP